MTIKYRVRSGDMDETVSTQYHASADAVCFLALHQMLKEPVESLGTLIEIRGGQFTGDNVTYMLTERLMRDAGLLKPDPVAPELLELLKLGDRPEREAKRG